MTLAQRRRRILIGIAIIGAGIAAFILAALAGVSRQITLLSSLPLWPAAGVLVAQWARIGADIREHGPDYQALTQPAGKFFVLALIGIVAVVAVGVAFALLQFSVKTVVFNGAGFRAAPDQAVAAAKNGPGRVLHKFCWTCAASAPPGLPVIC